MMKNMREMDVCPEGDFISPVRGNKIWSGVRRCSEADMESRLTVYDFYTSDCE